MQAPSGECVCVCINERERVCVCSCVYRRERERESVCVYKRERESVCVWDNVLLQSQILAKLNPPTNQLPLTHLRSRTRRRERRREKKERREKRERRERREMEMMQLMAVISLPPSPPPSLPPHQLVVHSTQLLQRCRFSLSQAYPVNSSTCVPHKHYTHSYTVGTRYIVHKQRLCNVCTYFLFSFLQYSFVCV